MWHVLANYRTSTVMHGRHGHPPTHKVPLPATITCQAQLSSRNRLLRRPFLCLSDGLAIYHCQLVVQVLCHLDGRPPAHQAMSDICHLGDRQQRSSCDHMQLWHSQTLPSGHVTLVSGCDLHDWYVGPPLCHLQDCLTWLGCLLSSRMAEAPPACRSWAL